MLISICRLSSLVQRRAFSVNIKFYLQTTQAASNSNLLNRRYFSNELSNDWPHEVKEILEHHSITQPTIVQEKTVPVALEGKDLVGIARTGSGKTLAFVLPTVIKILQDKRSKKGSQSKTDADFDSDDDSLLSFRPKTGPSCIVLAPTRELAAQISDVFSQYKSVSTITLVGGKRRTAQVAGLRYKQYDVVVATCGRLIDLCQEGLVQLNKVKYLILDEADRMMDMGFEPQIRALISKMPKKRQTLMFSATWPKEIQELAKEFMGDFEYIEVDSAELKANPNIQQTFRVVPPFAKMEAMREYLDQIHRAPDMKPKVLIFANTQRVVDQIATNLWKSKYRAVPIHGGKTQSNRDHSLQAFRDGVCNMLVATDVAARGLDISNITHVINFDMTPTIEDYVHRIGRTARHNKTGVALTLFAESDIKLVDQMISQLKKTDNPVPDELLEMSKNRHKYSHYENDTKYRPRRHNNRFYESFGESRQQNNRYRAQRNQMRPEIIDDIFADEDGQRPSRSFN